jgi:Tfp pilus assembly protein PilV
MAPMTLPRTPRADSAGYSLIECLLAMALLTAVLLSISGLFILGSNNVKSGRELTKATTIANSCMEQTMSWPYDEAFGFSGATSTGLTTTWDTNSANPTYTASTTDAAAWGAIADQWRTDVRSQLMNGKITYKVDGMGRLPTSTDPGRVAYKDAQFLRVTITVSWQERNKRTRSVVFEEMTL